MDIFVRTGEYKSIKAPLEWTGIPKFAVLTGENGTGKTQFLECLHGCLSPPPSGRNRFENLQIQVSGIKIQPSDVAFIPNMSERMGAGALGLAQISKEIQDIANRVEKNQPRDAYERPLISQLRELGVAGFDGLLAQFRPEFFYSDPMTIQTSISRHFVNYELDYANLRKRGLTHEDAIASLGDAPWEALNTLLEASGFAYEITTPRDMDLRAAYSLRFLHRDLERVVNIGDLSSGEAALVRLYFWLYAADKRFRFPKLVLLDEPDSHLNPTLIKSFIGSLEKGLIETLGCTVVMTTHRAETLAFTPDESLFEMHAVEPRIRKSASKHSTMFILTNNLVALLCEDRRPVFVEDEADVAFYERTLEILEDGGLWAHPLKPEFIAASLGKGKQRLPGGKDAVRKWVNKLAAGGLGSIVRGVIDRDAGNAPSKGVSVLARYSFENYLVDPLVVYGAALDAGLALPLVLDPPIYADKVYQLAERSTDDIQRIADATITEIRKGLQPDPDGEELHMKAIEYVNGKKLMVPRWLLERRGYDLLHCVRGPWPRLNREELIRAYNRLRLIPVCLKDVLECCVLPLE